MNLHKNPSTKELAKMIAKCDDINNHYFIAVDKNDDVTIEDFDKFPLTNTDAYKFYFDIFPYRRGYVGEDASHNSVWIKNIFDNIIYCAMHNMKGEVDYRIFEEADPL